MTNTCVQELTNVLKLVSFDTQNYSKSMSIQMRAISNLWKLQCIYVIALTSDIMVEGHMIRFRHFLQKKISNLLHLKSF
jgi:hypothetical protein